MGELARGTVTDRPWGRTLAALGLRGVTGQLTVIADGKPFRIAFSGGAVAAATSPLANDAGVRVALTGSLISSTQVADIQRRMAAQPNRDEIDVLAEAARLTPDHTMRLRRRVTAQRAARTFALASGDFVVRDDIELPLLEGSELDIRAVIYLGAKSMIAEARMAQDLATFGSWFQLKSDAVDDLPQFGFGPDEQAVLGLLGRGASTQELEQQSDIDPRIARAVVYALVSCNAVVVDGTQIPAPRSKPIEPPPQVRSVSQAIPRPQTSPPVTPLTGMPRSGAATATPPTGMPRSGASTATPPTGTPRAAMSPTSGARPPTNPPLTQRAPTTPPASRAPTTPPATRATPMPPAAVPDAPTLRGKKPTQTPSGPIPAVAPPGTRASAPSPTTAPATKPARKLTNNVDPAQAAAVESLIKDRLALIERKDKGDHFQLLGLSRDANAAAIRDGYFKLARQLHPDRLNALGIADDERKAQRLFAEVNNAFAVLNDPIRKQQYVDILARGGEAAVRAEEKRAEEMAIRILEAEEAFKRGEMALKRDSLSTAIRELEKSIQLNPDEPEFHATLAWAKFAAAPDKMAVSAPTRAALEKTIKAAPRSATGRFYLGRVERMLGKDNDALRLFKEVLEMTPNHPEATSEVRVLEARLAGGGDKGGGLFGRSKR
ncbi:MAG TPA: DnaJ domain-containing protein [Kofleriaceae bacterium]